MQNHGIPRFDSEWDMSQQAPWSVKGIDPKARSVARERAQRQGVTLGQYLNSLLLEGDEAEFQEVNLADPFPRAAADSDLRRMSLEIDQLAQRLEASTSRSARAVSGIDKSILGLMGKVDASGKAQLHALERVTRAMGEIETTQTALRSRIDSLESENRNASALDGLKSLESSLTRLAETLQERLSEAEREQQQLRTLFDEKVGEVASRVDDMARSVDQVVSNAVRSSSAGVIGRIDQIEEKVSSAERRIEAGIAKITDAASRFELFETKADRAVSDTTWRMERALESNMTRSRAMSKEVLDRVDAIEEKTREAMTTLSDAVSRISDRVNRTERKTDTAVNVLERAVNEIDDRTHRGARSEEDMQQLQQLFQKRLDSFAEDMTRPMNAMRADMERKLEEAARSGNPEKVERIERSIRQIQEQAQIAEARQADAIEAMSAQVDRLSRAVDERLRAVESRGDSKSIDDVRREIANLANTIDARLGAVETSARTDIGRLNTVVDDKLQALEKRSAGAIDAVGEQISLVAERLQRRHDESIQRLGDRIAETSAEARPLDSAEVDRLADRLDERVRESERRSAEAISQIGEQVARAVERLQSQAQDSQRAFEARLVDSGRSYEAKLSDVLSEVQRRMEETADQSAAALTPVQNTVSSLARRLESFEDNRRGPPEPEVTRDIPILSDEYVILEDEHHDQDAPRISESVLAAMDIAGAPSETLDIVGVEPPPFDKPSDPRDAHLFDDVQPSVSQQNGEPAQRIEDLLEADDELLGPAPPPMDGFVADLPADDGRERLSPNYLEEARRAARQGRRVDPSIGSGRKGIGKGPLIASAVLTVAVAGGAAFTVMRGKQEGQNEDFAKLDPAAPAAAESAAGASEAVLFGDDHADPAADILAPDPNAPAPIAATAAPVAAPVQAAPVAATSSSAAKLKPASDASAPLSLADAVRAGDPVALHDYALELLQTGEKARAVQMLKDAANRGLVMADYRLAKLYERGEGVPRDMAASRAWTEKAAIGGNRLAMHDLAVFYAEGDAGPQSYAAAVEWFKAAADLGLVDSQYNLAVLYDQGLGLSQDKSEAAYWFEVAGRAGDQDAGRKARVLLGDMQPTQAEAIKRKARAFNPKPTIARANGEFGRRPWDIASPDQIAEAQRLLQRLGYTTGATDGRMSTRTAEAIRQFERANDLPVTGEASLSLLRQLRAASLDDN
jgi:localization factor PodJL